MCVCVDSYDNIAFSMGYCHIPSGSLHSIRIIQNLNAVKRSGFFGKIFHDLFCAVGRYSVDQNDFRQIVRISLSFQISQKIGQKLLFVVCHNA